MHHVPCQEQSPVDVEASAAHTTPWIDRKARYTPTMHDIAYSHSEAMPQTLSRWESELYRHEQRQVLLNSRSNTFEHRYRHKVMEPAADCYEPSTSNLASYFVRPFSCWLVTPVKCTLSARHSILCVNMAGFILYTLVEEGIASSFADMESLVGYKSSSPFYINVL